MTILPACSLPIDVTSVKHKKVKNLLAIVEIILNWSSIFTPLLRSTSVNVCEQHLANVPSHFRITRLKVPMSNIHVGNPWRLLNAWIQTLKEYRYYLFQSATTYQFMTALMLQLLESIFGYLTSTFSDRFVTRFYIQCYRWKSRKGLTHT